MRYSGFRVIAEALTGHKGWKPVWRDPVPQAEYDYIIVGGGGHGLATAYYLAKEFSQKRIAVIAPAFSADCIETLEEINEEIKESFEHAGGEEFTYIPCLNDDAAHIDALASVVEDNLKGWLD